MGLWSGYQTLLVRVSIPKPQNPAKMAAAPVLVPLPIEGGPNFEDALTPAGAAIVSGLPAAERVAYLNRLLDVYRTTFLAPKAAAAAAVSLSGDGGAPLAQLELHAQELEESSLFISVRRFNSNSEQDRAIQLCEAEFAQTSRRLLGAIRRKERRMAADAATHGPGPGAHAGGAPGASTYSARPVVARLRLKAGQGTVYRGPDGDVSLEQFFLKAQSDFTYADNGADVKLTDIDRVLQLLTLFHLHVKGIYG